ncbi:hypothetical protein V2I01_30520 [Micromonospora sp. BRA006-A]|nr:hypothetical protein [Micromonospora sp. BRA006-A]
MRRRRPGRPRPRCWTGSASAPADRRGAHRRRCRRVLADSLHPDLAPPRHRRAAAEAADAAANPHELTAASRLALFVTYPRQRA